MYFHDAKKRSRKEIAPGATIRTFWGKNTLLSLVDIKPGVEVPRHTHAKEEQSGMVLDGEMEMGIGKEVKTLRAGDVYIIPSGVEHYAKTQSSHASVLDIFSPVREDYKY